MFQVGGGGRAHHNALSRSRQQTRQGNSNSLGVCPVPRPQISPRLLRVPEAARYLGVGPKVVRWLILTGQLPYIQLKPGGNSPFLLDVKDLDKFIETNKT